MTIIAAYEDKDNYWIGSDSTGVAGSFIMHRESKIIKKLNYCVGFTWSYRTADIIRESTKLPKNINSIKDIRKFRDILMEELIEKGHAAKEAKEEREVIEHPVGLIFITKIGIYEIECDYQIVHCHKFIATGSGYQFALGSLYTSNKLNLNGKTAVTHAVKSAIEMCISCGGKVYTASIPKGKSK